ncbi:ATP-binding protein [Halomonas sp. V046]|uniref:ATP-binding protein n=1 Tax=Halomonas sp. V046 TaxID=3459611 RepID=UPI0040446C13
MRRIDLKSLRVRLLLSLGGGALVVMGLTWVLHGILLRETARDFLGDRLRQEAEYTLSQLKESPARYPTQAAPSSLASQVFHHLYVLRLDAQVSSSHPAWLATLEPLLDGTDEALIDVHRQGSHLLVYRRPFAFQGHSGVLLVGEAFDSVEQGLAELHWWIGAIAGLVLVALIALNLLAVRAALKPIVQLQRQLRDLRAGRRTRIQVAAPSEIAPLITQLNRFMDAQDSRLARSRHAVADLSHAIKTPLAAVMQVMRGRRPIDETRRGKVLERLSDIQAQLEAQLRRARLAGPDAGQSLSVPEEIERLLEMFRGLYPDKRFVLTANVDASTCIAMERQDFMEMAGIVLDNAGKWARRDVRVALDLDARLTLRVEDDGEGVDDSQLSGLGQRGRRLDEQRSGNGLGLSILLQLVDHYRGEVAFRRATLGGLEVVMTLMLNGDEGGVEQGSARGDGAWRK